MALVSVSKSPEERIRHITKADENEAKIGGVKSWRECGRLIGEYHKTANQKGRELIEARFWLGGGVAAAHKYSEWGDNYLGKLSGDTGISDTILRDSMRLWDVFGGDVAALYNACDFYIENYGKVLWGDVSRIVEVNKELAKDIAHLRSVEGSTEDFGDSPSKRSLDDAIGRHRKKLRDMGVELPERETDSELPRFNKVVTLKYAKERLVNDPGSEVVVEHVDLDGKRHELVVSLRLAS